LKKIVFKPEGLGEISPNNEIINYKLLYINAINKEDRK